MTSDYINIDTTNPDDIDLLRRAATLVLASQFGSTNMLQRRLAIGYAKALMAMDRLEALGVVGPLNGPRPRAVLKRDEALDAVLESITALERRAR